ncbi:hypothetical protein Tco_0691184 [Tanacetum coccineum]
MDIFRDAWVFLEGTPVMGTKDFHYCPGVLGGDTCDGYKRVFINARVFLEGALTIEPIVEEQDEQQQQNMLDAELVLIIEQVKIAISYFRIALENTQPYVIYKVCMEILRQYSFYNSFIVTARLTLRACFYELLTLDPDHPFTLPAPKKEIISFFNELGCSKTIRTMSALRTNDMYKPWRTLLRMINKCLTRKAIAYDCTRLHML